MNYARWNKNRVAGLHVDHKAGRATELEPRLAARAPDDLVGARMIVVKGERIAAKPVAPIVRPKGLFDGAFRVMIVDPDGRSVN
jgi:hypothetical protein